MRFLIPCLFIVLTLSLNTVVHGQTKNNSDMKNDKVYDEQLAKKLGADSYGMKNYVFVLLKTGKAEITDEKLRNKIFRGHFSNISKLYKEGKLVLSGPFRDGGKRRGFYIFNVERLEEAKKLVETDPAVKAGIFEYELTKWYGSAALLKVDDINKKIQKLPIK